MYQDGDLPALSGLPLEYLFQNRTHVPLAYNSNIQPVAGLGPRDIFRQVVHEGGANSTLLLLRM